MSQIFRDSTSGPVPPTVPEQFTADDGTIGVPVANNFNLLSRATTENNYNGIQTTTDPNGSANHYTELTNRLFGGVSTNDSTPTAIITFPLGATPGTFTFDGFISAHNTSVPSGAGYFFTAAMRTTGAAAIEIGVEFTSEFEEAALAASDVTISAVGNNFVITVTGIAATAIDWLAQATYSRTP